MKAKLLSFVSIVVLSAVVGMNFDWLLNLNSLLSGKLWLLVVVVGLLGLIALGEFRQQPDYRSQYQRRRSEADADPVSTKPEQVRAMKVKHSKIRRIRKISTYAAALFVVYFSVSFAQSIQGSSAGLELEEAIYQAEVVGDMEEALRVTEALLAREAGVGPDLRIETMRRAVVWMNDIGRREEAIRMAIQLRDDPSAVDKGYSEWARTFVEGLVNPNFREVPWQDHELLVYRLDSLSGEVFGYATEWKEMAEKDGQQVWNQLSLVNVVIANQIQAGNLLFGTKSDRYRPLQFNGRLSFSDAYHISYDWSAREAGFRNEGSNTSSIRMPGAGLLFDVEQLSVLPRILDMSVGDKHRVNFAVAGGFFGAGHYALLAEETVEFNGESLPVEVWDVDLKIAENSYQRFTMHVEREVPRRVFKVKGDTFVMNLEESLQRRFDETQRVEIEDGRYGAQTPPKWVSYSGVPAEQRYRTIFNSPDGHAMAIWLLARGECCEEGLENVVNREANLLGQFMRNYKREGDGEFLRRNIGGTEALGLRGTYTERNKTMRDERYYFVDNNQLHWIVLRAVESDWHKYEGEFEAIIGSIRLREEAK
jgi:hypothetical protein